jgi:plasmid stabilization system protein ParE
MTYRFLPEAENDLINAVTYYEDCQQSLGIDFTFEVDKAIARILEYPTAWTALSKNCRRCLLNRFPYGIIYSIEEKFILIISIMNLHRHPDYWKNRI